MRNLTTTILTLVLVLGINVSSVQGHSQEHPTQAVQAPSQGRVEVMGWYQVALHSWSHKTRASI
jgi:hypothetical protein